MVVAILLFLVRCCLGGGVVWIAMDEQINLGQGGTGQSSDGDAIYVGKAQDEIEFRDDEPQGYTRHHLGGGDSFQTYVDLNLTGIGSVDMSSSDAAIEFDIRFFQDPCSNSNPYAESSVSVRIYTYEDNGEIFRGRRDFHDVYSAQSGDYPNWTHIVIDASQSDDSEYFEPNNVSRIRFYGANQYGAGDDFLDYKNLVLAPNGFECGLTADLTGDCLVDLRDLAVLAGEYEWLAADNPTECPFQADISGSDCRIDLADFAVMAEQWLCCGNPGGCNR